jgi:hypothetical protein
MSTEEPNKPLSDRMNDMLEAVSRINAKIKHVKDLKKQQEAHNANVRQSLDKLKDYVRKYEEGEGE